MILAFITANTTARFSRRSIITAYRVMSSAGIKAIWGSPGTLLLAPPGRPHQRTKYNIVSTIVKPWSPTLDRMNSKGKLALRYEYINTGRKTSEVKAAHHRPGW